MLTDSKGKIRDISSHSWKESLEVKDRDELASTPFCRLVILSTAARGDRTYAYVRGFVLNSKLR